MHVILSLTNCQPCAAGLEATWQWALWSWRRPGLARHGLPWHFQEKPPALSGGVFWGLSVWVEPADCGGPKTTFFPLWVLLWGTGLA